MTTTNIQNLRTEMVVFLRNSDILSTAQRGVTTTSNVFTATAAQTVFTLSNNVARNIRDVAVSSGITSDDVNTKAVYVDYTPDYKAADSTITFGTGVSLNSSVIVTFDYSSGTIEKIWSDYPEIQYLSTSIPRVGFDITGIRTKPLGIGDTNWLSDALVRIKVYDSNLKTIEGYLSTIREKIKAAQTAFYHFQLVTPSNMGPPLLHDIKSGAKLAGKVFEKAIDLICRFNFES